MRLVNSLRDLRRERPWLAFALALGIFAFAVSLRFLMGDALRDVPYITLFPAILIAALVGGLQAGVIVAVLSGFAAWYLFLPPEGSFSLFWPRGAVSLLFFAITAAIQLYVIRTLNLAVDELSTERDQSAVMFQELQHRVANNLQFISSLLKLQRQTAVTDPAKSERALEAAESRLELMARIHRRLYDPAAIRMPLSEYFQGLCTEILEATGAKNVVCVVETPAVTFDLRRLMMLSLLMNEVITNSVKHAFSGRQQGTISIRLDQEGNQYSFTITDDGRGLIASDGRVEGLGFRIMQNLAAQLGGQISFSGEKGMTARLVFPKAA
jgi:two-component sensor histidine kinase